MSDYDTDILIWSERQATLLRRLSNGEAVDAVIDWDNLIEEVADVGINTLRACRSLLRQALRHMLKAEGWPLSRDAPSWRADAIDFRRQAKDAIAPSMRHRIDIAALHQDALDAMPETMDGQPPMPVPDVCPVTLEDLPGDL